MKAMRCYVSLLRGSAVGSVERYGPGEPGAAGSVKRGFTFMGAFRFPAPARALRDPLANSLRTRGRVAVER